LLAASLKKIKLSLEAKQIRHNKKKTEKKRNNQIGGGKR